MYTCSNIMAVHVHGLQSWMSPLINCRQAASMARQAAAAAAACVGEPCMRACLQEQHPCGCACSISEQVHTLHNAREWTASGKKQQQQQHMLMAMYASVLAGTLPSLLQVRFIDDTCLRQLLIIKINPCKPYLTASAPRLTHWGGGK
jgi:hypothetical protein